MKTRRYLRQQVKLHMLRAADSIAAHGSILKASAALGVSQPSLTKSLRELEGIVQAPLFERHSRGARPTKEGDRVAAAGRAIMAELLRLDEDLDLLAADCAGTVAVGALPVAAAGVLPGVLARLRSTHPSLRVRMHEGRMEELLPRLASREVDLIVGRLYEPTTPDTLVREPLWTEPISVLARAGHPLLDAPHVPAAAFGRFGVVLPTLTQRLGTEIDQFLSLLGLNQCSAMRSNSYGFIREMVIGSDALAVMPRLMMVGDLLRGTLRIIPLSVVVPDRPAGLVLPPGRPLSPGSRLFVAGLRAYLGEISEQGLIPIATDYSEARRNDTTAA